MSRLACSALVAITSVIGACAGASPERTKSPSPRERARTAASAVPELDVMKVARALRGNEADLRECFSNDGEPVRGFMRLAFEVERSGAVSNVEIETSSFAEPSVAECLTTRVATLRFDAPGEKRKTHWTFVSGLYEKPAEEERPKRRRRRSATDSEQGVTIDERSRGSLEPEEIEEVVHAGFGLFAHCYREALDRQPGLSGTVRLRMVIGRDGVVDELRDAESEVADPELIDCVGEGFFALRFPKPRQGTVRLVYRIVFDSG